MLKPAQGGQCRTGTFRNQWSSKVTSWVSDLSRSSLWSPTSCKCLDITCQGVESCLCSHVLSCDGEQGRMELGSKPSRVAQGLAGLPICLESPPYLWSMSSLLPGKAEGMVYIEGAHMLCHWAMSTVQEAPGRVPSAPHAQVAGHLPSKLSLWAKPEERVSGQGAFSHGILDRI